MAKINKEPKRSGISNYKRNLTSKRAKRQQVYNSSKWRSLRLAYLMEHPLCEQCLRKGVIKEAENIHHIKSFLLSDGSIDDVLAYDYSNLEALCVQCHVEEHIREKEIRERKNNSQALELELKEEQERLDKIKRLEEDGD